jgi:Ca2+-binding RTX toxin-like protein
VTIGTGLPSYYLSGGDADDTLLGGPSVDRLYGRDSDDWCSDGKGADNWFGNTGADTSVIDDTDKLDSVELFIYGNGARARSPRASR